MDDDRGLTRRQVVQYGGAAVTAAALLGAGSARAATTARGVVDLNQPAAPFPHVWERVVGGDCAKQVLRRDSRTSCWRPTATSGSSRCASTGCSTRR